MLPALGRRLGPGLMMGNFILGRTVLMGSRTLLLWFPPGSVGEGAAVISMWLRETMFGRRKHASSSFSSSSFSRATDP